MLGSGIQCFLFVFLIRPPFPCLWPKFVSIILCWYLKFCRPSHIWNINVVKFKKIIYLENYKKNWSQLDSVLFPQFSIYVIFSAYLVSIVFIKKIKGSARYTRFLLPPAKGFALWGRLFMMSWFILGHFWCSVVTSVTFSRKLSNVEKKWKEYQQI